MLEQITSYAPWLIPVIALVGVFGAGWKYVKLMWGRVTSLVIINVELEGALASEAMIYFWQNFKFIPVNPRKFIGYFLYVRAAKRPQLIAMENLGGTGMLFWKGWRPIWVSSPEKKKDEETPDDGSGVNFTFFRGLFNMEDILESICKEANEYTHQSMQENKKQRTNRFYVVTKSGCRGRLSDKDTKGHTLSEHSKSDIEGFGRGVRSKRPVGYFWNQLGEQPGKDDPSPFVFLAYPQIVMKLVEDLEHWLSSQKWYTSKRIPWRWGVLSTGPPGSGKSSLIRAIGEHLGLPVYFFDLASMTNEDFITAWTDAVYNSPCIVAMEDADSVFNGRENITAEKGSHTMPLTFDCVLNRISGVAKSDGVILFVTSNNADTLDPALCDTSLDEPSRPGRIDTRIILDGMDKECRTRVAKVVLSDDLGYVTDVVKAGERDQPSQFHSRCAKLAQALYWARREGKALDGVAKDFLVVHPKRRPDRPKRISESAIFEKNLVK